MQGYLSRPEGNDGGGSGRQARNAMQAGGQAGERASGREMRRHRDCPKKHRGLEGVHGQGEMDERGAAGEPID